MHHGTVVADKFEIRELAGSGAMGSVYRAVELATKRSVAVKVLAITGASDLARFEREAVALARLSHPHIVGYVGRGVTDDGRPFLALDWLEGETLGARLGQVIPTLEQAVLLIRTLANALAHAHAEGVVHRDIKPANVFLLGGDFSQPRLLDFGVARVAWSGELTRTGTTLGTPAYMAPEQARGRKDVDARADIYALGCLLFECLTGRAPFEGDDVMAVLAKVLFEDPPRLSLAVPSVPDSLDELAQRMMDKEPGRRPQSAAELASLLASIEVELRASPVPSHEIEGHGRSAPPPRPLTAREQKLVGVVAVGPHADAARADAAETLAADALVPTRKLAVAAAQYGATFSPLANGSCMAVLEGEGSAADLALRTARCALAFQPLCPGLPIALVMGRATTGRVPVGEVIDRVATLVKDAASFSTGGILVDELAATLLERRFLVEEVNGALQLVAERDEPEQRSVLLGRATPFVGRMREIRILNEIFEEVLDESSARAVLVTGVAGIGKSRLLGEWITSLEARSPDLEVWSGRADPLSAGSPFGLVASALRSAARVVRGDAPPIAQRKLAARVALDVDAADADRVTQFLAEIIGAPYPDDASEELRAARTDPTLMGDQMRRCFECFVDAVAATRPLLVALEDSHWGDASSLRLMEGSLRQAKHRRVLLVTAGRLELTSSLMGLSSFRGALHVAIGELPRRACREFVDALLPAADDATRAEVVVRAAGNAFFLEELVRFLAEGRGSEMPPSIIAMLQSRLQSLPHHARRFLRGASVFGHAFWPEGVQHLLGEVSVKDSASGMNPKATSNGSTDAMRAAVEELLGEELIEARTPSRFPGRSEYGFRQGLVRDAAYGTLTERDRTAGHRLAGEWLEAAGEREALVLAEHLQRGKAGGKAARWFRDAAADALDGHDFTTAMTLCSRALSAMNSAQADPEVKGSVLLLQSEALRWSGDWTLAEKSARQALELLQPGTANWFQASAQLAATAGVRGDFRPVALWRERIASLECDEDAKTARLFALCVVGRRLYQLGDYDAANELVRCVELEYERLAQTLDGRSEAEVLRLFGARARHSGDVSGDLQYYGAALEAFDRAGDVRGACNALVSHGFSFIQLGDYAAARTQLDRAVADAAKLGLTNVETRANQNLCLVLAREGRLEEALELALRVVSEAAAHGDERFQGWTLIYASGIALELGRVEEAHVHADAAAPKLEASPPAYAGARAAKALAILASGDAVEADIVAQEAIAILASYDGIEEFEALVQLAGARCASAVGDQTGSRSILAGALARLEERADRIQDAELRRSFLEAVPENVALLELARSISVAGERVERASRPPPAIRLAKRQDSSKRTRAVWSANAFRSDAEMVVRRLGTHLDDAIAKRIPVLSRNDPPATMLAAFNGDFGDEPREDAADVLEQILALSPRQHHPQYVGHQVSSAMPRAAVFSLVAAVLNNGMAAFESGPATSAMERRVIDWMTGVVGWPRGGGVLTSGGSLGNLTALLAARQAKAGFDAKTEGLARHEPLALLASEQTHYSIERAAQILGLGRASVEPIATDARYRVDISDVPRAFERARRRGLRPIAVIASAGATGTGAVDPLEAIADQCERLDLWLHVDGAHGASALLSPRHREAVQGIARADSVVWDAHKLMSMPALATAVLFRDGRRPYEALSQDAAYLFRDESGAQEERWFDIGLRTIECTKPLLCIPLYVCLATLGVRVFREAIEHAYELARDFAGMLESAEDFELACPPDSNIVCFRYTPSVPGGVDVNENQRRILKALRDEGAFYCVLTTLRDKVYLRTSLMNPLTTRADLVALLERVRLLGQT